MARLAVIVAQGGVNSAGRTSGFNAYRRIIYSALGKTDKHQVISSLKQLCTPLSASPEPDGVTEEKKLLAGSLVRKINLFDSARIPVNQKLSLQKESTLLIKKKRMPRPLPPEWKVIEENETCITVQLSDQDHFLRKTVISSAVNAAGQLPDGFTPEKLYPSRSHPRGLAMTVYGASDAIGSMGIDWSMIQKEVPADKISVYAGSSMSQMDKNGNGGLLQARLKGERVNAKQLPLGFPEMPADFINAYILGNLGTTGTSVGACATFLYNLKQATEDIRSGKARIAIVGNSEAPLTPEIMDGYATMGALATDQTLLKLDGKKTSETPDYARACRPFSDNAGFVLGESAQFFVLMDDELALASGASILGSVMEVFVNADGFKKSISSPGAGNYITMAKSVASARTLFGDAAIQHSMVHAHGTGTPQNRVTESHILDTVAQSFQISDWPISAIKCHVGHSLATAAGDQLLATLGAWKYGIIPGITTIDSVAQDVYQSHLLFPTRHLEFDQNHIHLAFLNSKGFGGNNASATIISPEKTRSMLEKRYGKEAITHWSTKNEKVLVNQEKHENSCVNGTFQPIYRFGENVMEMSDISMTMDHITLQDQIISLDYAHPYSPYL